MSTVPHSVPSRLSVLTAELYGREDDTLIAWQRTCTQISAVLEAQHAGERLSKALALAQAGAVTLEEECALVKSASADVRYKVRPDGRCNCPDVKKHGVLCKHALAVLIHSRAVELLEPVPVAAAPAPAAPAAPRRGRPALPSAPAAPPAPATPPPVPTSAAWQVQEAPTSACFKFRLGSTAELLYTFRGVDDGEVLQRIATQLPLLHELVEGYAARAEAQAAARAAQVQAAAQAQATAQAQAQALPNVHELVQQAVQQALAAASNRHAPSRDAGPPHCPEHGAMRESTKAPGTWFCTHKLADGAYCTSKA